MKKQILIFLAIVLVLAATTVAVLAAGNAGTQDDPLVTVSYLNDKFKADIIKSFDEKIAAQSAELSKKIDEKLGTAAAAGTTAPPAEVYFLVALAKGQTLKCDVGAEVLLREGYFMVSGAGVSDLTSGAELTPAEDTLAPLNHLYLISTKDSGFAVTSDAATVLVRGTYTIA